MNIETPVNLFTTFSEAGYEQYGKRWLNSVLEYWPEANIKIYVDFKFKPANKKIQVIDFDNAFPEHKEFKLAVLDHYDTLPPKGPVIGSKTVKFSYKGFCIARELQENTSGITIWTDADTQVLKPVNIDYLKLLNGTFLACQLEKKQIRNPHVESGILIFDSSHKQSQIFGELIKEFYTIPKIFSIKKPYDGYIIGKLLRNNEIPFVDLNYEYNITNKRSSHNETFLHPILKEHFIHWIGEVK